MQFKTDSASPKPKDHSIKVESSPKQKSNTPAEITEEDPFAFANKKDKTQKSTKKEEKKDDHFLTKPPKNGTVKSDDEFAFVKKIQKEETLTIEKINIKDDFLGLPEKDKKKEKNHFSGTESQKISKNKLDF